MRSVVRLSLILACAVTADLAARFFPLSSSPRAIDARQIAAGAVRIDFSAAYAPGSYSFLRDAIRGASIVELGESIHVTAEFPLVRLQFIRYLHEQMGFDVLALEGSLTQAWLAQEHLYRSEESPELRIDRAQQFAWFKLWNTSQMRELMAYVEASQRSPRPLYLTSFDVQTGASAEFGMTPAVLETLVRSLETFGEPPAEIHVTKNDLVAALGPVVQCRMGNPSGLGAAKARAEIAIDGLQHWIDAIAPTVGRHRPAVHLAALRLVPDNLRDHVTLCEHATTWQATRDELNAENALVLRDELATSHKIVLWAHHSHVSYNSTGGRIPSMGQHIRQKIDGSVYTIGLFAGGGRFIDVAPLSVHALPALNKVGVERLLAAVGAPSYFVDLRSLPTSDPVAGWLVPQRSRMEGRWTDSTVLARDFDGAVYLERVNPGTGMMPNNAVTVLRILGFFVDHIVGVLVVTVGVALLLAANLLGFVRRRSTRTRATIFPHTV
jgi:erythromycin esterase